MSRTKKILSVLGISASLGMASVANATPLWEFDTAGNSFTNGSWDFATAFAVNNSVTATGLGYYADPNNGFVDNNEVALYECDNADCSSTGTLLASVTVTNIYPLTGHFRYVTIDPVLLEGGKSYEVAGVSHGDNYTWNDTGFSVDPSVSLIATNGFYDRWISGTTTPDFIGLAGFEGDVKDGFWGPNVFIGAPTFTGAVPEPTSLALLGIGGLAIVAGRRRKPRQ